MASIALISIFCPDRVGLVSAVADHLFSAGVNLRDTTFAALGAASEFTSVCELPDGLTVRDLEGGLARLDELRDAEIRIVPFTFDPRPGPMGRITHRVEIGGGDQLGLIARLSEIFTQYGANIVRLEAQKIPEAGGDRYVTRFAVWIPADRADTCLAAISNTAGSLGLMSRAEACVE